VDNGLLGGLTTPAPPFSVCLQGPNVVDNPVKNPFLWITLWKTSSSNLAGLWKTRPVNNPLWKTQPVENPLWTTQTTRGRRHAPWFQTPTRRKI